MNVKEVIKAHGETIKSVAEKIKKHPVTLTQSLGGNPSLTTLREVADAIGCKVGDFFTDEMTGIASDVYGFASIHGEVKEFKSADELKDIAEKL